MWKLTKCLQNHLYLDLSLTSTLSKISNWSPYIFCASFESKIRSYKIHASINQARPFKNTACHFILNGWYVLHRRCESKGNLISKSHSFFYNMRYSTETQIMCIFVCVKMFLTAVIKDEHASNDSLQSDSSFLFRNRMMTDTTSS